MKLYIQTKLAIQKKTVDRPKKQQVFITFWKAESSDNANIADKLWINRS